MTTQTSHFVMRSRRRAISIRVGLVARAILRVIDAASRRWYVDMTTLGDIALADGAIERQAAAMQLAGRLAEAFESCEAYEVPARDRLGDPRLRDARGPLRRIPKTIAPRKPNGC
jgi:hypothetical protein